MTSMKNSDFFLEYTAEDLKYEFHMLNRCKVGRYEYKETFLRNLCLEGWLLHARRIIESFQLQTVDEKWKKYWGLISQHLSHAKPANRADHRPKKRENPDWDIDSYHPMLIEDLKKIADQYKSEYAHYDLLIEILKESDNKSPSVKMGSEPICSDLFRFR